MKVLLPLFLLSVFVAVSANGQSFSLANTSYQPNFLSYASSNLDSNKIAVHRVKRMCTVTKIGLISIGAGAASYVIGMKMMNDHINDPRGAHNGNWGYGDGQYVAMYGFFTFGIGTCLAIGGGIHDIVNHHRHKLTLIAPKYNEVGIAYNF